jgi:hypothetical protein
MAGSAAAAVARVAQQVADGRQGSFGAQLNIA